MFWNTSADANTTDPISQQTPFHSTGKGSHTMIKWIIPGEVKVAWNVESLNVTYHNDTILKNCINISSGSVEGFGKM